MKWRIDDMPDNLLMSNFGLTFNDGDLTSSIYPSCCIYNADSLESALLQWRQLFKKSYQND